MDKLLALLLAAGVSTGTVLLTEDDLSETYKKASSVVHSIGETNKKQTLEAAIVLYQSVNQTTEVPSVKTLVDEKYLKPEILDTPTAP